MGTAQNGREPVVPIVSSSAVGPLGVCHLPRMWMKILLHATGRLPRGYRHGTGGFDETTALNLGFDRDEFIRFVETELPTYVQCEQWVREHASHLDEETIRRHNALVHRDKPPAAAAAQRAYVGLDDPGVLDATLLNDLDDWHTAHALLTSGRIPPLAFSSLNAEFTELMKALLNETGATRASIHVDMPAHGLDLSKAAAEAKRDPRAGSTSPPPPLEGLRRGRALAVGNDLFGPISRGGELIGFIALEGVSEGAAGALERAITAALPLLEEIGRFAVSA